MNVRKYLIPAIGAGAFIIGGLVARAKALDAVELIEVKYMGKEPEPEKPSE